MDANSRISATHRHFIDGKPGQAGCLHAGGVAREDRHVIGLGQRFEARSDVDGVAHYRIVELLRRTQIADQARTGIDANPHGELGESHRLRKFYSENVHLRQNLVCGVARAGQKASRPALSPDRTGSNPSRPASRSFKKSGRKPGWQRFSGEPPLDR